MAIVFPLVAYSVGKSFDISLFRLQFSPKTSLNIPSLHCVLSLILKTICVVFIETFVVFYRLTGAFELSWRFRRPLVLKKVNQPCLYCFPFSVYVKFAGHIVLFPINTVATSCNGSASSAVSLRKGVTKACSHFYDYHGIFSFHSIVLLVIMTAV